MQEHLESSTTSRIGRMAEIRRIEAREMTIGGRTGNVFGLNGEASTITFNHGKQRYNFVVIVENPEIKDAKPEEGDAWTYRKSDVIRSIFKVAQPQLETS